MTLRYALIGSGMMGHEHIRNIALLPDARVVAVADPDEGMRESAARLAGDGCRAFADYRAILSAGLADVLLIASPNHTHADILADVMPSNLPILAEKPVVTDWSDAARLRAAAERRSAPLWVAMEYRYMAPVARLVAAVHGGEIGRLRMLAIREHRFPFLTKVGDWNRFSRNTGGTLVEKCCHFFDLMRLITESEATRVYASGAMDVNHVDERYDGQRPDILDNAFVTVDFANGVRAMLDLCMFAEGTYFQEDIAATGDKAKVEARCPGPARFWPGHAEREAEVVVSDRETKRQKREVPKVDERVLAVGDHHGSTYFQHAKFLEIVKSGGRPEVTLEDGLAAVRIGLAAEESARSGEVVRF
jgi:myo-inositol 2-dehydrogenase/D-chiro-inositol 1-dehydrogenase